MNMQHDYGTAERSTYLSMRARSHGLAPTTRRRFLALAGSVAASTLLAACGNRSAATETPRPAATVTASVVPTTAAPTVPPITATQTPRQTLVIEAVEYGFKTMGSIPAGPTTVLLKNLGQEDHEAQFIRLNDGVTVDQFMAALKQSGGGPPPPIFTYAGGATATVPGRMNEVVLDLAEGQYVLICLVNGPDKQSHVTKGMVLPLTVRPAGVSVASLPAGAGTITLGSIALEIPATLPTGKHMFRVTNAGKGGPHALEVGRIPADKTLEDVLQATRELHGPAPWYEPAGGMDALGPGGSGVAVLDLMPGTHVALDLAYGSGHPIGALFTVS